METSDRKRVIPAIIITVAGVLILVFLSSYFSGPKSIDVNCLINEIEKANITEISEQYANGYIDENWTIAQIMDFYWLKEPKSRWAAKLAINYYLLKCEKKQITKRGK